MSAIDPGVIADGLSEMDFKEHASFGDGRAGVFWSGAGIPSLWEMHPDCDEMLQVLEGAIEVEVLPARGGRSETTNVPAGSFFVVPRAHWHRQTLLARTKEFYLSPGSSMHSTVADPRTAAMQ